MPQEYILNLTDVPNTIRLSARMEREGVFNEYYGTFCYKGKEYHISIREVDGFHLNGHIYRKSDEPILADSGTCYFETIDKKLNESWEDYIKKMDKSNDVVQSYTKWNPYLLNLTNVPDAIILHVLVLHEGVVKEYCGTFHYNGKKYITYIKKVDETNYRGDILTRGVFAADSGECHLEMINKNLNMSWEDYLEKTSICIPPTRAVCNIDNSVNESVCFSSEDLEIVQAYFHELILKRADPAEKFMANKNKRLPVVSNEIFGKRMWYPVPGMYGGFEYVLSERSGKPLLTTESWCRIVGGSGQRHEITIDGCVLVEEGFV